MSDAIHEMCLGMDRKHNGKKEKMLVTSIFSFSHEVFKSYFRRVVKTRDCLGKG